LKNFKKVFQITKILEFGLHQRKKKLKFLKLWNWLLPRTKRVCRYKKSGWVG